MVDTSKPKHYKLIVSNFCFLFNLSDDCGETAEVWPIVVGIVLGILFLGLLAVIIWRAAVYWMVKIIMSSLKATESET